MSVSFLGGDGKYHVDVWSAVYTRNGFEQLQPNNKLLPLTEFGIAELTIQGVAPYPDPLPLPKKKQTAYDLLD